MQEQENRALRSPLKEAGLTYSVAAVAPIVLSLILTVVLILILGEGYADTQVYLYISYLLPQLCLGGAAALFIGRTKLPLKKFYAGCKWYYFPLAILLSFGLFAFGWVNNVFIGLFERLGYVATDVPVPDLSGWNLLPAILVIGIFPAFFEETVFRGIGAGTMRREGWGTLPIVLISGALFSLFHGNPVQTVYQFICGACYALLAVRSGSVLPGMLAHLVNNAAILIMTAAGYGEIPAFLELPIYLTAAAVFLAVMAFLIFTERRKERGMSGGKGYFLAAGVGIITCAAEWIGTLIGGFL